jgi:hypothetical protein
VPVLSGDGIIAWGIVQFHRRSQHLSAGAHALLSVRLLQVAQSALEFLLEGWIGCRQQAVDR